MEQNILNDPFKLREYFNRKLTKCSTMNEDVMATYYGIKSNGCKPILMEGITINRLLTKHGDNGFIIISANRSNLDTETNQANTMKLKQEIAQSGYSYLPVYGGYKERDSETHEELGENYEPSFVVFNYDRNGNPLDFVDLTAYALQWCGEYDQDSVYVKAPDHAPVYADRDGKLVNKRESNGVKKNNYEEDYFTVLSSKHPSTMPKGAHRFTADIEFPDYDAGEVAPDRDLNGGDFENIDEWYCNPVPCTLNEMRRRDATGEIMLWR